MGCFLRLTPCWRRDTVLEIAPTSEHYIVTPIEIGLGIGLVTLILGCAAWVLVRGPGRQQTGVKGPQGPAETVPVPPAAMGPLIEAFSQRLAASEGRVNAMAAQLEGLHVLQQRVSAIEANMPAVQEAYEKYADQISRADKRNTERQRRSDKTSGPTAGETAAAMALTTGGGVGASAPAMAPPPTNNNGDRPWVLGGAKRT